jgi:hypothetical protein
MRTTKSAFLSSLDLDFIVLDHRVCQYVFSDTFNFSSHSVLIESSVQSDLKILPLANVTYVCKTNAFDGMMYRFP